MTVVEIPTRLLHHTRFSNMSPKPGPVLDKFTVTTAMIDWMHENADEPFRFSPIYGEAEDRIYPVGCNLYGSPNDLMLFRVYFGF